MNLLSNEELSKEWRTHHDPLLDDYEGFERFCEIRLSGSEYPIDEEDVFLSLEPVRTPFHRCEYYGHQCLPKENRDAYWGRNNTVAETMKGFLSLHSKRKPVNPDEWPLHGHPAQEAWLREEFHITLTEEDIEAAWQLFSHKEWFNHNGYYVKNWLGIAFKLGLMPTAERVLENTEFPHADDVRGGEKCKHIEICPMWRYRTWLQMMPIEQIPDDVFEYPLFRSNLSYWMRGLGAREEASREEVFRTINNPNLDFRIKWIIRKMIRDYATFPRCSLAYCNRISYAGIGEDRDFVDCRMCWHHIKQLHAVYETKVMPLKFQDKAGQSFGLIPTDDERQLRLKFIAGDQLFDDVTDE